MTEKQSKGGKARARKLSAEQRKEIAESAAAKRWNIPKATHKGEFHLGPLVLPCYVLEDGRRVLSQRGLLSSLGMSKEGKRDGERKLASFLGGKSILPHVNNELIASADSPVSFMAGSAGMALGYEASVLADICDAILQARKSGNLLPQQEHIAAQAEILIRSFAKVGIVALVDEATGYQEIRDKQALQAILDKFLAKELAAWAKRFPDEFYMEIFRLRKWIWKGMKVNKPQIVAYYTKDIVYERLAPGILEELERRNPANDKGQRKSKHHQWLTTDIGHPALAQHLHAVIGLMRISAEWEQFKKFLDKAFPKRGDTLLLPMELDN